MAIGDISFCTEKQALEMVEELRKDINKRSQRSKERLKEAADVFIRKGRKHEGFLGAHYMQMATTINIISEAVSSTPLDWDERLNTLREM